MKQSSKSGWNNSKKQYVLRASHKSDYPTRLLIYDAETKIRDVGTEQHHRMKLGWTRFIKRNNKAGIVQDNWRFWDYTFPLNQYINSLVGHKQTLYVFGHNVFFDLQSSDFFYYFPRMGWELDFIYDAGLVYILTIHDEDRHIKIVSTTNYFDYSLKHLGDELGLKKLDIDFKESTRSDLITYCQRDVQITSEALLKYMSFNKTHDMGRFCMTRSSQALTAYRHRFMNSKIYIHKYEDIVTLERSAYFGGRTECFYIGTVPGKDFVFLDVNSMYPFVMKNNLFPVELVDYREEISIPEVLNILKYYGVIAEVEIKTNEPIYAKRINGKLCFPVGTFDAYLCTGGIKVALRKHHIQRIKSIAIYDLDYIFSDYVDYFYPLKTKYKNDNNKIYTKMVKLYLNGLYGKFGEKRSEIDKYYDDSGSMYYRMENIYDETGEREIEYKLFNTVICQFGEKNSAHTLVAIPAHVTEYARLMLYRIMKEIGLQNIYYCDTDSIAIKKSDLSLVQHKIDKNILGALAVDKKCSDLRIYGCKDYEVDGVRRTKGIPKNAVQVADNSFEYTQFLGQSSHLREGKTRYFITRKMTKTLQHVYDKGIITSTGRVEPLILEE